MTDRQAELIELIHKEVKPALGCTEPIAAATAPSGGRRPISASPWK